MSTIGGEMEDVTAVRPPTGWLVAAGVTLTCAAGLLVATVMVLGPLTTLNVVGYLVGSLATISLVTTFRMRDQEQQTSPYYSPRPGVRRAAAGLLVGAAVVSAGHAWIIATRFAS